MEGGKEGGTFHEPKAFSTSKKRGRRRGHVKKVLKAKKLEHPGPRLNKKKILYCVASRSEKKKKKTTGEE